MKLFSWMLTGTRGKFHHLPRTVMWLDCQKTMCRIGDKLKFDMKGDTVSQHETSHSSLTGVEAVTRYVR